MPERIGWEKKREKKKPHLDRKMKVGFIWMVICMVNNHKRPDPKKLV